MSPATEPKTTRKLFTRALMWAAAIGILAWMLLRIDRDKFLASLIDVNLGPFLAVAIGFSLVTLILDALTHWWAFRRFNGPADFRAVFLARGESYLLLSLGFLYGQGGMAYVYSRRSGKPLGEVSGTILFIMLSTLLTIIVMPSLVFLFFPGPAAAPEFKASPIFHALQVWLIVSWPLIIAHFVFWGWDWKFGPRQRAKLGAGRTFDQAGALDYLVMFLLRALQMALWVVGSWIGLDAAHAPVPLGSLFLLGPIIALATTVPTPGRLGTTQLAWVFLFGELAGDPEAVLAFSLLWTVIINLFRWLLGAAFLAVSPKTTNQSS